MPKYDFRCERGHIMPDQIVPYGTRPLCPECGSPTEIIWLSSFPNVIPDDVPGGFWVENMTRDPEKFYCKSDWRRRQKELGVRHRDEFCSMPGTDKNPKLTKWW